MVLPPNLARRLLPFAAFLTAFTVVLTLLFMSMDIKTVRRRRSFNLSQDLDFRNVAQDNPQLIVYIQAVHLRQPQGADEQSNVATEKPRLPPAHSALVAKLLHFKKDGTFLESGAYRNDRPSDTEWLEQELGWHGLLIQPDPMDYLTLRKHHRRNSKTLHGCLSPTPYPKEVTFRQGAKGISLKPNTNETKLGQEELLTRVKCFPLYSLLLATNLSTLDYLSLDADGAELQVLRTVPMLRVDIHVINVRCHNKQEKPLIDFMVAHNYRLQVVLDHAYIFVHKMVKV